jgi:ribonuclease P protein component
MHTPKHLQKTLGMLKKRSDFLRARTNGRKWVARGMIVQVVANDGEQKRVGYTVSKKVDKSAVRRNRIKRRLRSVAAGVLTSGHAPAGYDYVLIGRPETATRPYEALTGDLQWCLRKLDLIKDTHKSSKTS